MIAQLSSNGSQKSLEIIQDFCAAKGDKCILLKPVKTISISRPLDYKFEYMYGHRPEATVEFFAEAELVDDPKDKAAEIVRLFESINDDKDVEFLKRYFQIKLK